MKKIFSVLILIFAMMLSISIFASVPVLPNPVIGVWYPIYNNWVNPTTLTTMNPITGNTVNPLSEVNVVSAAFVHIYNSNDPVYHFQAGPPNSSPVGNIKPPDLPDGCVLGYENSATNNGSSTNASDYDYNRIITLAETVKEQNPKALVLVCIGWSGDWSKVDADYAQNGRGNEFVPSVISFINNINLANPAPKGTITGKLIDGLDIDYESGMGTTNYFSKICPQLSEELHSKGLILSVSPAANIDNSPIFSCLNSFDLINLQLYGGELYSTWETVGNKVTLGVCEEGNSTSGWGPITTDLSETANNYFSYSDSNTPAGCKGVFLWTINDDNALLNTTYSEPLKFGNTQFTYASFPFINYFYQFIYPTSLSY